MRNWLGLTLACAALGVPVGVHAAPTQPMPANPIPAQTSLGFNPNTRCPDLRVTDEGTMAVVVFWLPRSSIPAQISIKTSSGSNALDAAAMSCVARLRFAAATRIGDGEPFDSWQQIAFRWADQGRAAETRATVSANPLPVATPAPESVAGTAPMVANAKQDNSGNPASSVTVHVCVDESGKLEQDPTIVQTSGSAALDQAAVRIAASGSAYYRPAVSSNKPSVSGCAQLTIKFDVNR